MYTNINIYVCMYRVCNDMLSFLVVGLATMQLCYNLATSFTRLLVLVKASNYTSKRVLYMNRLLVEELRMVSAMLLTICG